LSSDARPDGLFDTVIVRPPLDNYQDCVSSNPQRKAIDLGLAKRQHNQYVSVLRECGVRVIELHGLNEFADSVFMQDPAVLGLKRSVIGRFGEKSRRGEEDALLKDLKRHKMEVGQILRVSPPGTLEGGDIVVTPEAVFVGESKRTNSNGVKQLADFLHGLKVIPVRTGMLHLLCGCSYLTDRTMIICPDLVNPKAFGDFRFVKVPENEAYATDALYVGSGRVVIPTGFPRASKNLKEKGFKPVEVETSEFYKGDGGVTCLSSPIYKVF
jgi:dimethylargininase